FCSGAIEILQTVINRQTMDAVWMQNPSHVKELGDLNYELADKYSWIGQFDTAIPLYSASLRQAPKELKRIWINFYYYLKDNQEAEIISLKEISNIDNGKHLIEAMLKEKDYTHLYVFGSDVHTAAIRTKQFHVCDRLYEPVIRHVEKTGDYGILCILQFLYGNSLRHEHNLREKTIKLWESSLSNYLAFHDSDSKLDLLDGLIDNLAPIYLQRILVATADSDSKAMADNLSKLSGISPEGVVTSELEFPPQLWLTRYYHLIGDDTKARETMRSLAQVVIELLSDEDESNDGFAFNKARRIFASIGDDQNTLTALAWETRDYRSDDGRDSRFMRLKCYGGCSRPWEVPSEMLICKHCLGVRLDDGCMAALKEIELPKNQCKPYHEFIKVSKWDEEWLQSIPKEMVPWGDQTITLDQWKQEIREVYLD
ncbi:unnamed protein product, partial [Penicillium salamii]